MLQKLAVDSLDTSKLSALSPADYDLLAFGVIELDRDFVVRTYNSSESSLARRPASETIGHHFFRDIAPCTDRTDFRGHVEALMRPEVAVDAEARFDFVFLFTWGKRRVRIRALRGIDSCWLFVTPLRSFDE
jgi:photoactive yellow protein